MTVIGYGSVRGRDGDLFAAYRRGDDVIDLRRVDAEMFASGTLDFFLAAGPSAWARIADAVRDAEATHALAEVRPQLPFTVADYVDFYASEHHATNAGRIFRPDGEALPPNWKHVPVGYHGRSGSLTASGAPVPRPNGVRSATDFGPSQKLDFEAELAFVVGTPGTRIAVEDADEHVFGVCLLNDWSARDIQAFETVPLGPFLGKSFATSVSPWITPLTALEPARIPTTQDPQPLPHLRDAGTDGLDLDLEVAVNGHVVSRPRFADMYWTYAQMLAHLTSNGAAVRTGDVFASGTVSGPDRAQHGCLLELSWNGTEPMELAAGETRTWLLDGDEVVVRATAGDITLGEVTGRIPDPAEDVALANARVEPNAASDTNK